MVLQVGPVEQVRLESQQNELGTNFGFRRSTTTMPSTSSHERRWESFEEAIRMMWTLPCKENSSVFASDSVELVDIIETGAMLRLPLIQSTIIWLKYLSLTSNLDPVL